jgi:hypothetical protein
MPTTEGRPGHLCRYCQVNWIPPRATKCPCGAVYRANGYGCLASCGSILIILGLLAFWGLAFFAFWVLVATAPSGSRFAALAVSPPIYDMWNSVSEMMLGSGFTALAVTPIGAVAICIVFVVGMIISFKFVRDGYEKLITRYSWHSGPEPTVIYRG